ncbi:MAG: hypothetical protein AAGA54_24720 [Myxococcota bacterium]
MPKHQDNVDKITYVPQPRPGGSSSVTETTSRAFTVEYDADTLSRSNQFVPTNHSDRSWTTSLSGAFNDGSQLLLSGFADFRDGPVRVVSPSDATWQRVQTLAKTAQPNDLEYRWYRDGVPLLTMRFGAQLEDEHLEVKLVNPLNPTTFELRKPTNDERVATIHVSFAREAPDELRTADFAPAVSQTEESSEPTKKA